MIENRVQDVLTVTPNTLISLPTQKGRLLSVRPNHGGGAFGPERIISDIFWVLVDLHSTKFGIERILSFWRFVVLSSNIFGVS